MNRTLGVEDKLPRLSHAPREIHPFSFEGELRLSLTAQKLFEE
ncbi:hypothetical protein Oweho_1558 [Owenweeksia hongkongensis DSM 17368]|uniref:Uncharacterized protein n=1 Tax=Owenweeksia hongkongensis (strain DSM 17368 / CIP 108786 / JCM 12287 / NRRL B-23963 / UST20020801) TaxID=926562 RepID=G8QZC0_OWEHD|nr:hypothetical protein Oweho_1558 [Owenweeksia hongkongensis DSM 17368]